MNNLTQVGEVWVDSGQVIVVDPCYIGNDWNPEYTGEETDALSYAGACHISQKSVKEEDAQLQSGAVAISSGYGDGSYPVFAEYKEDGVWGKRLVKLVIDFAPDLPF